MQSNSDFRTLEKIEKLGDAAANLYGVISIVDFTQVYHHYEHESITNEEMNQLLNEVKGSGNATFVLVNDLILSSQLEKYINTQVLKTIIDDQKGRERYLPHKKLFLKYRTEGFIDPSNEYEAFKSFIKKSDHKGSLLTDDALNNALQSMHKIFQVQPDFDTVSDLFVDPDYIYSSFQEAAYIEEFFDRIQNSTRLFSLNGYSPNEYGLILRKQNEKNN